MNQNHPHAAHYRRQSDELRQTIQSLRARAHGFVVGEIITFIGIFVFLVLTAWKGGDGWIAGALASLVAYVMIRRMDVRNDRHIRQLDHLKTAYDHELQALRGDYSSFDDGARYVDVRHAYSFDLDLFGRDSLYQRLCRTATTGGSDRLAHRLCTMEPIDATPGDIDRLAADEPRRMTFIAQGVEGKIDTDAIREALLQARQLRLPQWASSRVVLVLAIADLLAFWVSIVLAIVGLCSAQLPIWWGILQFFAVYALCNGQLRKVSSALDTLHGQLHRFEALDDHHEHHSLTSLVDALDRRGNILGLFLINTLALNDLFTLRTFLRWRDRDAQVLEDSIDRVVRQDELVTVATLRYNHPETTWPVVTTDEEVSFVAKGLWHPFLDASAVRNDFRVDDCNFYIVTGANMAGKSTFLRAVGVNTVLALSGLPVFAEQLTLSRFRLFTSMRTNDDLTHGISYFNAELLRLKQLIEALKPSDSEQGTLIILDEILKGTNSADKLNGSRMFLEAMSSKPVAGIIATHDLKLSEMTDEHPDRFHNYCFEIQLGADVTYSYRITPGVAKNQNATFLLRQLLSEH